MRLLITGITVTAIFWFAAWSRIDVVSEYSFFPLWVGYILLVNGLSEAVFGTSLLTRMRWSFLTLFAISIPMWWFFEYMNSIVHNWHYVFANPISTFHYTVQSSIDFSTVVPAVLSAAFFVFQLLQRTAKLSSPPIPIPGSALVLALVVSFALFVVLNLFPNETFPLVWIIPILILESISYRVCADASLLRLIERGELALPVSVAAATLGTGFWWECWNIYSLPKWVYTIPYVDFWKIFEMPLLGYLGYPFFGIIVFSYTSLALHVVARQTLVRLFSNSIGPPPAAGPNGQTC